MKKKRKFYEDLTNSEFLHQNGNDSPSSSKHLNQPLEMGIRHDIFNPAFFSPQVSHSMIEHNTEFLKPMTSTLTSGLVAKWTPAQVGKFVSSVPRLNCDLTLLEKKIVEEEIDGEAFLLMTQNDFVHMLGMKLGPAIKVYNALILVKKR